MCPNNADRIANSVDPDQSAPVKCGSALFAYLSKNLGSLQYFGQIHLDWSCENMSYDICEQQRRRYWVVGLGDGAG